MILEIQSDAGKVDNGLDSGSTELLGVTDTRALQNQWRRESASRDDNLLASTEHASARILLQSANTLKSPIIISR